MRLSSSKKLTASDGITFDRFGWSVSINGHGNMMAVGASEDNVGKNTRQGSAYILFKGLILNLTMIEWGMILFIVLAGLGSIYYLVRQRRN